MKDFSPNIVGFACQWCTYAGADLAGNLRCKYPPTVKLIKVPCSGRVEGAFVLDALGRGADAVFVGGCHFGDCHYKEGNYKTQRRMQTTREMIEEIGLESGRFRCEWISGSEGLKFAEVMTEYTGQISEIGPNPLNGKALAAAASGETVAVMLDGEETGVAAGTSVDALLATAGIAYWLPRTSPKLKYICNKNCPSFNIVDVDGRLVSRKMAAGMPVQAGMNIQTRSEAVAAKLTERLDWLDQKGNCRLVQKMQDIVACEAENSGLFNRDDRESWKNIQSWTSAPSIFYDPELCVRCGNCVDTCNEVQKVGALSFDSEKGVVMMDEGRCVRCGQCIHACPTGRESDELKVFKRIFDCGDCSYGKPLGAIREVDEVEKVIAALDDPKKYVVIQFAPSIRASVGEEFDMPPGTLVVDKLYTALKKAGFDRVWDTNFTADLTIMEEGTELILRLAKAGILKREELPMQVSDETLEQVESALPQFTSCSPGWVKFCETFYPDLIPNVSSAKSPQQMLGAVAKTYGAEKLGVDPKNMVVVSVMPCTAKKFECARDEMTDAHKHWKEAADIQTYRDVDVVLTTRECGRLLKRLGIHLPDMEPGTADPLIGQYTGAATIFGRTGGVMEAAIRTAYELLTGTSLEKLEFEDLGTLDGVKRAALMIGDKQVKVAVAHGLKNCRTVCDSIREGGEFKGYQFIEFMCCPGGCIGGGGQPIATNLETIRARTAGLNAEDKDLPLRKSHENPEVTQIYAEFLGQPVSHLAHHLLHTRYTDRSGDKIS